MNTSSHRPRNPASATPSALALLFLLLAGLVPAAASAQPVMVHGDEWATTVPCEDLEDEHPDAVRRTQRGFLGVELTSMTEDLLRHFGVEGDDGVMISKIVDGSPAHSSGLKVGDIVTRFAGHTIESNYDLGKAVRNLAGRNASAEVWRNGKLQKMSVRVGSREMCTLDFGKLVGDLNIDMSGFDFDVEGFEEMATQLGLQSAEMGLRIAEEVTRSLGQIDWQEQMESLEKLNELDEERMESLQLRLKELEKRMEKEYEQFGERYEREIERALREKERALESRQRELEQRQNELIERNAERHERVLEEQNRRVEEAQRRAEEMQLRAEELRRQAEEKAAEKSEGAEDDADDGGETLNI